MKNHTIKAIVLAVGFAFSAGAMAESMSRTDYKAGKDTIEANYKTAKEACESFSGNAKDICTVEAKGREKVARAELEANYQPTAKNRYKARVAAAEADYSVAKERCDDKDGNAEDVCKQEARAAKNTAVAKAKEQMSVKDAYSAAGTKSAEAHKDATATANDGKYDVAKEKCETYAGGAKDHCLEQAKKSFGKN